MFGFIVGTACLIGFVALARNKHHHCGPHGRRFGGRHFMLNRLLSRLDTTPGQEKLIRQIVDEFVESGRDLKRELLGSRREYAEALRGEVFDEGRVRGAFQTQDSSLDKLQNSVLSAFARIHETLDERQRKLLADWLEAGPGFGFYRHASL